MDEEKSIETIGKLILIFGYGLIIFISFYTFIYYREVFYVFMKITITSVICSIIFGQIIIKYANYKVEKESFDYKYMDDKID